jgi:hypothetical protein
VLRDVLRKPEELIEADRARFSWKGGCWRLEQLMAQACQGSDGGFELRFERLRLGAQGLEPRMVGLVSCDCLQ